MPLNGYDIASYQKGLDVSKVPSDFVIVKATQGTGYTNPCFAGHVADTLKAGKLLGIYHYATGVGVDSEASHFCDAVKPYIGKAILILDWESGANHSFYNAAYALRFLQSVKQKTGITPLIYMSKSVCQQFKKLPAAANYPLWVAQYKNMASTGYQTKPWTDGKSYTPWSAPVIHQYTSNGVLTGWAKPLDLDIAYLTADQWNAMAGKKVVKTQQISGNDKTLLKVHDKGSAVKAMQQMLIACGYSCGSCGADGDFGTGTFSALCTFQKARGIAVDGIYGPQSEAALKAEYTTVKVARDVIAGKYGNGADRKKNLIAAGYNYEVIQKKVNDLV